MRKILILFFVTFLFALTPQEYLKIGSQEAIYDAANEFYKNKEYKKAISLYKKITKPSLRFKALYNLGNAYAMNKEFQKAIKAYKEALKIKKDKDALYNLKLIEKLLKKHKKREENKNKQKKKTKKNHSNNTNKSNKNNKSNPYPNNKKNIHKENNKKDNKNNETTSLINSKQKQNQNLTPYKKKLSKFKVTESNTSDIRKRYYMHKLKDLKFNTLLLPLRSQN